jgi:hypothetical protein
MAYEKPVFAGLYLWRDQPQPIIARSWSRRSENQNQKTSVRIGTPSFLNAPSPASSS